MAEKNTLLFSWSPHVSQGVFLYNRLLWLAVGVVSLVVVYRFFPMSVEALTAGSQGRRAAKAKQQEAAEAQPRRSLVAARFPQVHQHFGGSARLAPVRLPDPGAHLQHRSRSALLGDHRSADRVSPRSTAISPEESSDANV